MSGRGVLLTREAVRGPRNRLQTPLRDGVAALLTNTVLSAPEALERSIDGIPLFICKATLPNRDELLMTKRSLILHGHAAAVQSFQAAAELRLKPLLLREQQFPILL
jgi:hypothetical protein